MLIILLVLIKITLLISVSALILILRRIVKVYRRNGDTVLLMASVPLFGIVVVGLGTLIVS